MSMLKRVTDGLNLPGPTLGAGMWPQDWLILAVFLFLACLVLRVWGMDGAWLSLRGVPGWP